MIILKSSLAFLLAQQVLAVPLDSRQLPGTAAPPPVVMPGQNESDPSAFLVYNADNAQYPFTIHLPDRTSRSLPPLVGPVPMVLSLSGSGARGAVADAVTLSGYDGVSRFVHEYYQGNESIAHTIAVEELLVVTPVSPLSDDTWDIDALANIVAQVTSAFEVNTTRIYLSSYSMGSWGAWNFLQKYPDLFAGAVVSAGSPALSPSSLTPLLNNHILNFVGEFDTEELRTNVPATQQNWDIAMSASPTSNGTLHSIGPILGADHVDMSFVPWQEQSLGVDAEAAGGVLGWLMNQTRPEAGKIPTYAD